MSEPCATVQRVFVAAAGVLYCLDPSTGELRWSIQTGASGLCPPTAGGDLLLVGGGGGEMLAIEGEDGSSVWSYQVGGEVEMAPWPQGGEVFVAAGDDLVCLDRKGGKVVWRRALEGRITTPPGGKGECIFVATGPGLLYVLEARTGRVVWRWKAKGVISGRISCDSGALFFGTWGGEIRALPLPKGLRQRLGE